MSDYSKEQIKSLVGFLKDFQHIYLELYTVLEDWVNSKDGPQKLKEQLEELFPHIYRIMYKTPFNDLDLYIKDVHEGPVAAWRKVHRINYDHPLKKEQSYV